MNAVAHALYPAASILKFRANLAQILYIPLLVLLWLVCLLSSIILLVLHGLLVILVFRWRISGGGPLADEVRKNYTELKESLDVLRDEVDSSFAVRFTIWPASRSLAVIKGRLDELLMAEAAQYMLERLEDYEITEDGSALFLDG